MSKTVCIMHGVTESVNGLECKECAAEVFEAANTSTNSTKVDITKGAYTTICYGIVIGSAYDFCPKCGTNLW